jgi:4-hydroxy-2-oxoglutarate aldolase
MTAKQIVSNLKGVFPPVITTFNRKGDVDLGRFRENLQRYTGIGLSGVVIAGSTGEAPYLTDRERLQLIEVGREVVRPPELLIAATGLESTLLTLRLSREAVERGVDALLVITPNYYKPRMDAAALQGYFRAIADGVRRPVIMYNIPQFTGIRMSPETIGALARHPNIAALKESSGDLTYDRKILRSVPPGFRLVVGSPLIFLDALRAGATGGVLGQADIVPELCLAIYDAFQRRQMKRARDLQQRLSFLAQNTAVPFGIAGVKAAVEICGLHAGPPRAPLQPVGAKHRQQIAEAIRQAMHGLDV